jgi:hypothetical protein
MNEKEYIQWRSDAQGALSFKYSPAEVDTILCWWDTIRGSEERELIGESRFNGMMEFLSLSEEWTGYDANMARIWIYAPYILKRAKNEP